MNMLYDVNLQRNSKKKEIYDEFFPVMVSAFWRCVVLGGMLVPEILRQDPKKGMSLLRHAMTADTVDDDHFGSFS